MASMVVPSWRVAGVVSEVRELKTKAGQTWAFAVKVMAMGGTFELQTQEEGLARKVGQGQECVAVGRFESFQGNLKLVLTGFEKAA